MEREKGMNIEERLTAMYTDESIREKKARWVTLDEAKLLLKLATEHDCEVIFESGTANGLSASWMSLSGKPVITFDPVDRNKIWDGLGINNITYVNKKFSEVDSVYPEFKSKRKMFFIDGDHGPTGVGEDCAAVERFASEGDLIILHDLNERYPFRGWKRLSRSGSTYQVYETPRIIGEVVWKKYVPHIDLPKIPNLNTLADVIDRLIVEVNKLSFFENKKREEHAKENPDAELISHWDNLSRDCCEYRSMLKNEINRLLQEIVNTGAYNTLKELRTFREPKRSVADILADRCWWAGSEEFKEELKKELEQWL